MLEARTAVWERVDEGSGHGFCRLERLPDGWRVTGCEVLSAPGGQSACWFTVTVDDRWLTRTAEVRTAAGGGDREVRLRVEPGGRWLVDGALRPDLEGCVDVDIAATPATNTFPIRRLAGLATGQSVTSPVAWVDVPSLRVARVDQTYRRLAPVAGREAWQYGDPHHGRFTLTVDDQGVVLDYEGFARRVGP